MITEPSNRIWKLLALLALLTTGACQSTEMELPSTFLELDRKPRPDGLLATTPDEARLRVRTFETKDGGDLAFWDEALRYEFAEYRGYTEEGEARGLVDADGHPGLARVWFSDETGRDRGYLVALFVEEEDGFGKSHSEITVVEFSARVERFRELLPSVIESITTLDH